MPPSNQFPEPYQPPVQPGQQPPQPDESPYDFFMEENAQRKRFSSGGPSKIVFIALAAVGLIVLLVVIGALVFGGKDAPTPLISVAGRQQEIIRVATDGTKNARTTNLQNFAITAQSTLTSAQQETIALLGKLGTGVDPKVLATTANAQTTAALASSISSNTYDSTFASIMQTELTKYSAALDAASAAARTKAEVDMIKKHSDGAALLTKQLGIQ